MDFTSRGAEEAMSLFSVSYCYFSPNFVHVWFFPWAVFSCAVICLYFFSVRFFFVKHVTKNK